MPDEAVEQIASVITGAEEAATGASEDVADVVVETEAGDGGAVAASQVAFDLSTDEGIRAAVEANPTLRGYLEKTKADAENTARQRRDAELRREQGAVERAQAYHQWLVGELEKGTDPQELARQTPVYVKANHDVIRLELAKSLLEHSASLLEPTEAEPLMAMANSLNPDDAEGMTRVAQASLNAVVAKAKAQASAEAKETAEKEYAKRLAAELEAAKVEARTASIQQPPPVAGTAPSNAPQVDQDRLRLQQQGIPLVEEATRKRIAAALGVPL